MMRIKIDKLKEGDNAISFDTDETSGVLSPDYDIISTGQLSLNIQKSGTYLHIQGSSPVNYRGICDRCAEEFGTELVVNIDYFFHIGEIKGSGADDVEVIFPERNDGDLIFDDYFQESFILAQPLRSLCSTDCKGLCANCGANLNIKKCRCADDESTDPRWETLTRLLNKDK